MMWSPPGHAHHPHDPVGALGVNPNFPLDGTLVVNTVGSLRHLAITNDHGRSWATAGGGHLGGPFKAVEFAGDWSSSGVAYAASINRGLSRSDDRCASWTPVGPTSPLSAVAIDPSSPAGQLVFFSTASTVFRSDEGGDNPQAMLETAWPILSLEISPHFGTDSTLVATTQDSLLYTSRNGGRNWTTLHTNGLFVSIEFSTNLASGELWAASWGGGVQYSSDAGASFQRLALEDDWATDIDVRDEGLGAAELWVTTATGLYLSIDSGASWDLISVPMEPTFQTDIHFRRVVSAPRNPDMIVVGTFEGLFISTDHGTTWHQSEITPPRYPRAVALSPAFGQGSDEVFYIGYGMLVLHSDDAGNNWNLQFEDFRSLSGYSLRVSPLFEEDQLVFVGTQHGLRRSSRAGADWQKIDFGTAFETKANHVFGIAFSDRFATDGMMVAASNRTEFTGNKRGAVYRSTDRGLSWQGWVHEIDNPLGFAISPSFSSDSLVYLSTEFPPGIFESTDGGVSFGRISDTAAHTLVIGPEFSETGRMFSLSSIGVGIQASDDRGRTWSPAESGLEGAIPQNLAYVEGDGDANVYVASTEGRGFFVSEDPLGTGWEPMDDEIGPVPDASTMALSPAFAQDGTLYAGNLEGMWRTTSRGANWELLSEVEVYDDARNQPWIVESGSWTRTPLTGTWNETVTWASTPGARLSFPFHGTGLTLLGGVGPQCGQARIWINGRVHSEIDTYAPQIDPNRIIARIPSLPPKFHRLGIEVLDTRHPQSTGSFIAIDGIAVNIR